MGRLAVACWLRLLGAMVVVVVVVVVVAWQCAEAHMPASVALEKGAPKE